MTDNRSVHAELHILGSMYVLSLLAIGARQTCAAEFIELNAAAQTDRFSAQGLSSDGSVVAFRNLLWSSDGGFVSTGGFSPTSSGAGLSADGSVIVGAQNDVFGFRRLSTAARWTAEFGGESLGTRISFRGMPTEPVKSWALGVSADGSVIVGAWDFPDCDDDCGIPFRWTAEDGMIDLGINNDIQNTIVAETHVHVSDDGSTVVGTGYFLSFPPGESLFRWTEENATERLFKVRSVGGVSSDGSVIVGSFGDGARQSEAFRWTEETGAVGLGAVFEPTSISGDGSKIVGHLPGSPHEAVVWDVRNGMRTLVDVLTAEHGLDLDGWSLNSLTGPFISADGQTIVGNGTNPSGNGDVWMMIVPEPSSFVGCVLLCACLGLDSGRHRDS